MLVIHRKTPRLYPYALALILAAAPLARAVTFTDVTSQAGINHVQSTQAINAGLPGTTFMTGGVAAGDFDNDGLTDLLFTRFGDTDILYRNLGNGTFIPLTTAAGFNTATPTNGVVSGDIDNDGDLDLYMTGGVGATRNFLYLNDGNGVFTDAGPANPATLDNGMPRNGQGATFADYDNDGYLDLMTSDWGTPAATSQARLFRNLGAANPGVFEDVTTAAGIDVYRDPVSRRFSPRFVDLDRDGHMDLTIASDFRTSQLFWNNGDGTFTDGTLPANVGTDLNGMGTTFADYDGDGDLDWFITNITAAPGVISGFGGWNRLYRNNGDRTFTDVTQEAGVRDSRWSWGTSFFDADNDSDFDLIATNGYNGEGFDSDRTFLWQNDNATFTDVSDASGITDTAQGRGLAYLDYDNDGDLDLVIVNNEGVPILYRNDGGNDSDYLRIHTEGTLSNRDGIGAFITLTPDLTQPDQRTVWEIDGGSSFLSQNEHTAHFGLGASDGTVDLITIQWPSGLVQHLHNTPANQTITALETDQQPAPGDIDFDAVLTTADIDWLRTAINNPALYYALFAVPASQAADLFPDGLINTDDVDHLVHVILGTFYGDLNLDGQVTAADLATATTNQGLTTNARWADGDQDGDGDVDSDDLAIIQSNLGLGVLPGDLNGDGFVGIEDLNLVLGNWNQSVPPGDPLADPSGDGFVGIEDLNVVLGNWNAGTPPPAEASVTVPEPGTLMLLGLGIASLIHPQRIR